MVTQVFQKLALSAAASSTTTHFSQAIDMAGSSSALVTAVIFTLSGGTAPAVSIVVQHSNDLENWSDVNTAISSVTTVGYSVGTAVANVLANYARLKVSLVNGGGGGTAVAVLSADINTVVP